MLEQVDITLEKDDEEKKEDEAHYAPWNMPTKVSFLRVIPKRQTFQEEEECAMKAIYFEHEENLENGFRL